MASQDTDNVFNDDDTIPVGDDPTQYSRSNIKYAELEMAKRKHSFGKRIGIIVGCVVLAAVLAGGAYLMWFTNALDSALASSDEDYSKLKEVLTSVGSDDPYYVLIMGSDSREGNYSSVTDQQGNNERSDVMILARVDAKNKKVTLLTIPRDTPYCLADGSYVKINQIYNSQGTAAAVKAVSELTGVPISHHATIRVSGLENIVDMLGGVTVDVPVDLSYETMDNQQVTIEKGKQTLNGQEAQIFARARHEFEDSQDEHRQSNVRQLLTAIISKILDRPLHEIPDLVLNLAQYIDTDLRSLDAAGIAMAFAGSGTTVYTGTGPSDGEVVEQAGGKWLCYLNPEGWQKIVDVIEAGDDPSGLKFSDTQIPWSEVTDQPDFDSSLAHHYYYGTHTAANGEWVSGKIENSVESLRESSGEVSQDTSEPEPAPEESEAYVENIPEAPAEDGGQGYDESYVEEYSEEYVAEE